MIEMPTNDTQSVCDPKQYINAVDDMTGVREQGMTARQKRLRR